MFLFDRIDFVALVGLWVQAFVAWVFVAILGALRRRERPSAALESFFRAFVALAAGLLFAPALLLLGAVRRY